MMNNPLKIIFALIVFGAAMIDGAAQERDPFLVTCYKGREEAAEDIKKGIYIIKTWGHPGPLRIYAELLKEEYNITVTNFGCTVGTDVFLYMRGYNEVALKAIEEKYGAGILEKVRRRADAESEKLLELPPESKSP